MSKAYTSNLSQDQWELLERLIPAAQPGGRPREVNVLEVLNAIFYLLTSSVLGAIYQEIFQRGKRCIPISVTGVKMGLG